MHINLQEIVIANGIGVGMMVFLWVSSRYSLSKPDLAGRVFLSLIRATALLCILETGAFYIDGMNFPLGRLLNLILNTLLFILNITFVYLWVIYVDYKLFADYGRIEKKYLKIGIPAIFIVALCVLNLFIPVLFRILPGNVYSRMPLSILPYLVSFFYLAYAEALIYRNQYRTQKNIFLPSVGFIIPLITGTIIQFLFYGISTIWVSLALSLTFIYINLQNEYYSIDPLSGLFTRQYLDHYLDEQINRSSSRALSGIMMDVDRFKNINDRYGHLAGDRAIHAIGEILGSCTIKSEIAARYGGDEFVVLGLDSDVKSMEQTILRIEKSIEEFNTSGRELFKLSLSYGYASFEYGIDNSDRFLKKMDQAMYSNKKKRSSELPDRRSSV